MPACPACSGKVSDYQAPECPTCGASFGMGSTLRLVPIPGEVIESGAPEEGKSSGLGCVGVGALGFLWLLSLVLGIAGAIPYGGSNGFLTLSILLTWAGIIYAVVRVSTKIWHVIQGKKRDG